MRSPDPNRNSSHEPAQGPIHPDDLSDLRNPERNSPLLQHRVLYEAFLRFAKFGFAGEHKLILNRQEMTFEDRVALGELELMARRHIEDSLKRHGHDSSRQSLVVRALHRVIAVNDSHREKHLYLEVFGSAGKSVLCLHGCSETFERGPVAIHAYLPKDDAKQFVMMPLVSRPAFEETVENFIKGCRDKSGTNPAKNWALHWVLQALSSQSEFWQAKQDLHKARDAQDGAAMKALKSTISVGILSPARVSVLFNLGAIECESELSFNEARQQPDVFMRIRPRRSSSNS